MRRLAIGVGGGSIVSLVLLDTALWWAATGQIEAAMPGVSEAAAHMGWRLETGAASRAGWPFTATVRFPAVRATRPLGGTTIRWTAAVEASLSPFEPRVVLIAAPGRQTVRIGEAEIPVQGRAADLRVPLSGGPATFELRDLELGEPRRGHVHMKHVTGEVVGLAASFTADGVAIAPALQPPFAGPLAVSAAVHMTAAFPEAATPAASAKGWQQAGGRVEWPAMTLRWGPLAISGSGEGGLDAQLQPQGQARLLVSGAAEALDAAGRAGLLAPGPEAASRAVLSLLTLAARGGPVPITVTLADRTITVAQFPLVRLPPLDWN